MNVKFLSYSLTASCPDLVSSDLQNIGTTGSEGVSVGVY